MFTSCKVSALIFLLAFSLVLQEAEALSLKMHKHERPLTTRRRRNTGTGRRQLGEPDAFDLKNKYDLYYSADMTIGNKVLGIQLDSGSSDLWVRNTTAYGPDDVQQTSNKVSLRYGYGRLDGVVATADVTVANLVNPDQAFLMYQDGDVSNVFQAGLDGMLGLGFNAASIIYKQNNSRPTLLNNYFANNPQEPRTIAFAMSRESDGTNDAGLFMLGEPEATYAAVKTAPSNPVYINTDRLDLQRWAIYLDAVEINGKNVTGLTSRAKDAPPGKLVANIDSGTSYAWAPQAVVDAIYGTVPGAVYFKELNQYTVPCMTQFRVALWFNGVRYPIHPLDVARVGKAKADAQGHQATICTGTFVHDGALEGESSTLDLQLGDTFMRNVITQYDFGDLQDPKTASVRMLSTVHDELAALNEFLQTRAAAVGEPAPPSVTDLPGDPIPGDAPPQSPPQSPPASTTDGSTSVSGTATTVTTEPTDLPVPTDLPGAAPSDDESSVEHKDAGTDSAYPSPTDNGGNGAGSLAPSMLLAALVLGLTATTM